jgi:S-DNA-T family DNA segregation ATPase FtsK/SpoIIIE
MTQTHNTDPSPSAGRQPVEGARPKPVPPSNPLLAWSLLLSSRLGRYWGDLGAVLLLALAVLTLFGLLNLSSGALLTAWAGFLRHWLGWGALLVPATLGWLGWTQIASRLKGGGGLARVSWWRVIAAEGAAIALLGMLNLASGSNAAVAANGQGGGLVGWGLGRLFSAILPPPADALAFLVLFIGGLFLSSEVTTERLARALARLQSLGFDDDEAERVNPFPSGGSSRASSPPPAAPVTTRGLAPERKPKVKLAAAERVRVPVQKGDAAPKAKPKKRAAHLPGLELLDNSELRKPVQKDIDEQGSIIVKTLKEFGVPVSVVGARVGPSVTQYHVEPGFVERPGVDGMKQWKVRVAQISSLSDDLALALSANTLRIEAPVPGQRYVGIEVPHRRTSTVSLRPVLESDAFQKFASPLAIALGRDVSGAPVAADLGKMPHLLIAGTTGSGKSVCIASLVMSLIVNNTPDDLRLVLIDPKMVELVRFNGLPHLFGKVETDLDRITGVLRWVTREMDRRYKLFEAISARNLENYNTKTARKADAERLPRLVVMVDELADLMMRAPDETERTLVRLAQMARATGIHLVVATQRPSTDIVTGLIKANFPARISFAVTSLIDSRVILDTPGAESLLGRGDMLFLNPEAGSPVRLQGCFVGDREIDRVVGFWRAQAAEAAQDAEEDASPPDDQAAAASAPMSAAPPAEAAPWEAMLAREAVVEDKDQQIEQAIAVVKKYGNASASLLQRKMRIGYPRAARLMDELREMGIVGREQTGGKTREVFVRGDDDPIGERAARLMSGEDDEDDAPEDEE